MKPAELDALVKEYLDNDDLEGADTALREFGPNDDEDEED